MSPPNPFVELARDPVATLATLAYALLLLGATVALAGVMWSTILHLSNAWEHRRAKGKFGPQWELVPPVAVFGRVALLLFLGAVEAFLLGGVVWLLT